MGQHFKNIYFSDYPSASAKKKNLTLAFGEKDSHLYTQLKPLSSHETRELLGHPSYAALQASAEREGLALGTFCLRVLRQKLEQVKEAKSVYLVEPSPENVLLPIEPIQTTFRGGQTEPLHNWYPYLEGYSPNFVEYLLTQFAPKATRILDPFSGTGTTPLTASRSGLHSFYCELNPLLQYLTEAKVIALSMGVKERQNLVASLDTLATDVEILVEGSNKDAVLQRDYFKAFGKSLFFGEEVFDQILQARGFIDELNCTDPMSARFLSIAVLSSLIPASRLVRRGDLRFKTSEELKREQCKFLPTVQGNLRMISADLLRIKSVAHSATLVSGNARDLEKVPPLGIEAVVTSPPYLNGTNYFRNTKVELWFLRCLRTAEDLSSFRDKAITAGINDVTVGKTISFDSPNLKTLVQRLGEVAYDSRIPRMVATYFSDMQQVLAAVKKHLVDDAVLMIDIGDSSYSSIHVPTHSLLKEVLEEEGFVIDREITLRRRMSRSGFPLSQVLLSARLPKTRSSRVEVAPLPQPPWFASWDSFKADLPHQKAEYAKRNWGNPLHSLCSYQGKMKPALASHLVATFVPEGGAILDPFAGVGTIPFEAALQGKRSWAFDISPAALCITSAKLAKPISEDCERQMRLLEAFLESELVTKAEQEAAAVIRFNGNLPDYFDDGTFDEVLLARRFFFSNPPQTASEALVMASLLHILHGNRPYALSRRSHPITPFAPTGPTEYRPLIPRLQDKVRRSLGVNYPASFCPGETFKQDATLSWPQQVEALDAIITSPPFFDSTRFYQANWMRLWFCGWEAKDFQTQPLAFVDERQKISFEVYASLLRQARERLKTDGVVVFHLGESRKCNMAEALIKVAAPWFRVKDFFSENVEHCESHGIRDKGTVTAHQYLVLG